MQIFRFETCPEIAIAQLKLLLVPRIPRDWIVNIHLVNLLLKNDNWSQAHHLQHKQNSKQNPEQFNDRKTGLWIVKTVLSHQTGSFISRLFIASMPSQLVAGLQFHLYELNLFVYAICRLQQAANSWHSLSLSFSYYEKSYKQNSNSGIRQPLSLLILTRFNLKFVFRTVANVESKICTSNPPRKCNSSRAWPAEPK